MSRRRLVWKVAPSYISFTLLAMIAVGWLSVHRMRGFFLQHTREDLEMCTRLLDSELPSTFPQTSLDSLQQFCKTEGRTISSRITLVAKDGRVLGDSDADPRHMENHAGHPEVKSALAGHMCFDVRYSITVHKNMMYLAAPVLRDNNLIGVVRASLPLTAFESALNSLVWKIVYGGVIVALLSALITLYFSKRLSRPIVEMVRGAERFTNGDLTGKLLLPDTIELASLAETLNRMAAELDVKIKELTTQHNEQQAILSSMREGVIAVDMEERVLFLNRMAGELFAVDNARAKNRLLQESIRSSELHRFLDTLLKDNELPAPQEITLPAQNNRILQISGSFLRDARGEQFGALVVLNDITRLRQLEGLRKEFVANVSHELKTPITTIKGFIETLREGALDDPENAPAFLERIAQNADRLNALLDDLLSLSRIEKETDDSEISLVPGNIQDIVQSAIAACSGKAAERQIRIRLTRTEDVTAMINSSLLEQAIINLLDNAIKYSEPGQPVEIDIARDAHHIAIRVRDHGCGISSEHLPRLFERFYRVDKARSRTLGGTGLGLAIVKHIAMAHGGSVTVESQVAVGSTLTISIPAT